VGYADPQVEAHTAWLSGRVAEGHASTSEAVELALLLAEPCHCELDAVDVLQTTVTRDPGDGEAALRLM